MSGADDHRTDRRMDRRIDRRIDRRTFLGGAIATASGVMVGASTARDLTFTRRRRLVVEGDRMLDHPATEAAIDTVVVVMLENRSFDHLFGWLASNDAYLEVGRRRFGRDFHVVGSIDERYEDPEGQLVHTVEAFDALRGEAGAVRGCDYKVPGHTWKQGRVQRDRGFLAEGSGNDEYAISYFRERAIPNHAVIASSFTLLDHYYSSLLGPTFPNRQYLHSAQSEGAKTDPGPLKTGIFHAETIWDRLRAAGVTSGYYYTDVPLLRLWGARLEGLIAPVTQYFEQAESATLPHFVMVDPSFKGESRADGHPRGDVRMAAAFTGAVLEALLRSPQWERSLFVVAHDEWGGFYDHLPPVHMRDARASRRDADDFGQAGFRVAAALASPFAAGNSVDHSRYDHTSILRFLEWRFLGAPAHGAHRGPGSPWWLTTRDRFATPIGQTLQAQPLNRSAAEIDHVSPAVRRAVPECGASDETDPHAPFTTHPSFDEEIALRHPEVKERPWEAP